MKLKKLCYAAAVALATCLIHNASAKLVTVILILVTTYLAIQQLESDGCSGAKRLVFHWHQFGNSDNCTIPVGDVETVGTADGQNIFGPQWGATLNIYGSLRLWLYHGSVSMGLYGNRSTINMYSGSSLTSTWAAIHYCSVTLGLADNPM